MTEEEFRSELLAWYDLNKRDLPWRETDAPYRIWISEIMLQQTRVEQATPYFHRFMERFPDVESLAQADRQDVLKAWEGLGYYSRARNMHDASKMICEQFDGKLPSNKEDILKLKGVGPYTAAAVLSIAFQKPHAVVDGNVMRVLCRYLGIEKDIRKANTKNEVQAAADELLDTDRPGDFNQALMELGATVCTPANPECDQCPISRGCSAYATLKTDTIPYKAPRKKRPHHQIGVGVIYHDSKVLIAQRPEEAMLGGLWEFPGGKQKEGEEIEDTVIRELREELGVDVRIIRSLMKLDHAYSHFKITLHAYICRLEDEKAKPVPKSSQKTKWVKPGELQEYPFPKANRKLTQKLNDENFQKELDLR